MRRSRISLLLALSAFAFGSAAVAAPPAKEPFFPRAGNKGYDVEEYRVKLVYEPKKGGIEGTAKVFLTLTEGRANFSFDFFGTRVREVWVDEEPVRFHRRPGKLVVIPDQPIQGGSKIAVTVHYRGLPPRVIDPDGTPEGWQPTDDGVLAVGEPQGTAAWIPCNNVPGDKARFSFQISVPEGLKAIANGRQGRQERRWQNVRFNWIEEAPMSPYLAVLSIGRGRLVKSEIAGLPSWTLIDPRLERAGRRVLRQLPEIIRFQSRLFGGYPFESAGSILDYAPDVGYALETQSRPIYTYAPSRTLVVHEVAHQWFGDSVGVERWPDIWLNEGLATWTQWYYAERHGGRSAEEVFKRLRRLPATNELWNPPPGRPGSPERLFAPSVYVRGAMTVQALRQEIGTKTLLRVLRRWLSDHRHGNATIAEFIALTEEIAGQDLDRLFQRWLYQRGKPR